MRRHTDRDVFELIRHTWPDLHSRIVLLPVVDAIPEINKALGTHIQMQDECDLTYRQLRTLTKG